METVCDDLKALGKHMYIALQKYLQSVNLFFIFEKIFMDFLILGKQNNVAFLYSPENSVSV